MTMGHMRLSGVIKITLFRGEAKDEGAIHDSADAEVVEVFS